MKLFYWLFLNLILFLFYFCNLMYLNYQIVNIWFVLSLLCWAGVFVFRIFKKEGYKSLYRKDGITPFLRGIFGFFILGPLSLILVYYLKE